MFILSMYAWGFVIVEKMEAKYALNVRFLLIDSCCLDRIVDTNKIGLERRTGANSIGGICYGSTNFRRDGSVANRA